MAHQTPWKSMEDSGIFQGNTKVWTPNKGATYHIICQFKAYTHEQCIFQQNLEMQLGDFYFILWDQGSYWVAFERFVYAGYIGLPYIYECKGTRQVQLYLWCDTIASLASLHPFYAKVCLPHWDDTFLV